jgi:hypothetical protein
VESNTPKLHRNERKDPGLSTGVYENHFLGAAYEGNVRNGSFGSLAIPWGKINTTSLSLKRLECFIEDENVEMKLVTKNEIENSEVSDTTRTLFGAQTASDRFVSSKANKISCSSFSRLRTLTGLCRCMAMSIAGKRSR